MALLLVYTIAQHAAGSCDKNMTIFAHGSAEGCGGDLVEENAGHVC